MLKKWPHVLTAAAVAAALPPLASAAPPFSGTIFIAPNVITSSDPTAFLGVADAGQGTRLMFDRRLNSFANFNAYLFNVTFSDGLQTEIQVNPEFGSVSAARLEAQKYAPVIGRLPTALRAHVETVWIHKGTEAFGGGNKNLLIHTGQGDLYAADGILEETFVHEASHTSLDSRYANAPGWISAQSADGEFISTYARDNPTREDIAETFFPYLAVQYRPNRISQNLNNTVSQTVPNRIQYLSGLSLNMYPLVAPPEQGRTRRHYRFETNDGAPAQSGQVLTGVEDSSGNERHAIVRGKPQYQTTPFQNPLPGQTPNSQSYLSSSSGHIVLTADTQPVLPPAFTAEMFLRLSNSAIQGAQSLLRVDDSFELEVDRAVCCSNPHGLLLRVGPAGNPGAEIHHAGLSANTAYHVAATYDGQVPRLYVNGQLVSSGGPFTFAGSGISAGILGQGFTGNLDEFRISNAALSPAQFLNSPFQKVNLNDELVAPTSNIDLLRDALILGRRSQPGGVATGTWDGAEGVSSTLASEAFAANGKETLAVGYARNDQLLNPFQQFAGQEVFPSSLLVKVTRNGDATLDGVVNNNDITVLAGFYRPGVSGRHWHHADFNFDGFVDNNDITILAGFYNPSAPPLSAPTLISPVPEPSIASFLMPLVTFLPRRRRNA